jgi:hypothetical protein
VEVVAAVPIPVVGPSEGSAILGRRALARTLDFGRGYVSQVVFVRDPHDDGRVVPAREPAFWLGVAYAGTKVTGSTSWSAAYSAGGETTSEFTDKMLGRARAACDQG